MTAFKEGEYEVQDRIYYQILGLKQVIELRKNKDNLYAVPYISIITSLLDGTMMGDLLLLYISKDIIDHDWRFLKEGNIDAENLKCDIRMLNHNTELTFNNKAEMISLNDI